MESEFSPELQYQFCLNMTSTSHKKKKGEEGNESSEDEKYPCIVLCWENLQVDRFDIALLL